MSNSIGNYEIWMTLERQMQGVGMIGRLDFPKFYSLNFENTLVPCYSNLRVDKLEGDLGQLIQNLVVAMETRHAADLKKILEMIEADKKEMAQKMQAMQEQIQELLISQNHGEDSRIY
nr:hypothetical protein CTI12_AA531400 [Tanacetum cinerariifolium]